jgi:hypothetical protein
VRTLSVEIWGRLTVGLSSPIAEYGLGVVLPRGELGKPPVLEDVDKSWGQRGGWGSGDWVTRVLERMEHAWDQACVLYKSYCWILSVHGFELDLSDTQRNTVLYRWFLYGCRGQLEKVLKWKTAWLLAKALLQDELPEAPSDLFEGELPAYLFVGRGWQKVKMRICTKQKGSA